MTAKLPNIRQATILKVSAVAIAAPRFAGIFVSAIGSTPTELYPWLVHAELISGFAMAVLEGFAVSYVLSKWRLLKPGSTNWVILLILACLLALTLPMAAIPYLLTEQSGQSIAAVFAGNMLLQAAWSFLIAFVPLLVVMAVGFADSDQFTWQQHEQQQVSKIKQAKKQAKEQAEQGDQLTCEHCGQGFPSKRARAGHMAHCKAASIEQGSSNDEQADKLEAAMMNGREA